MMSGIDLIVIVVIVLILGGAITKIRYDKKQDKGCGGCTGCSVSSQCHINSKGSS